MMLTRTTDDETKCKNITDDDVDNNNDNGNKE